MANLEETKIIQVGTSSGIRLKKEALWHLGVTKDDPVLLSMDEDSKITIRKMNPEDKDLLEANNEEV